MGCSETSHLLSREVLPVQRGFGIRDGVEGGLELGHLILPVPQHEEQLNLVGRGAPAGAGPSTSRYCRHALVGFHAHAG